MITVTQVSPTFFRYPNTDDKPVMAYAVTRNSDNRFLGIVAQIKIANTVASSYWCARNANDELWVSYAATRGDAIAVLMAGGSFVNDHAAGV